MGDLFTNQVAVVTGAGEGIGLEIARQLALQGAAVVLNDLDEGKASAAALSIQNEGGDCIGIGGDVGDVAVVRGLVARAVVEYGRLDIAVANAGLTYWIDFFSYEPEQFERILNVNLGGSYFLAQTAARQMREQGDGGRILLMSSVTGHQAIQYASVYSMTKAALEMMARNLVVELSQYGITINAVAPGATVTPRNLADDPNYEAIWGGLTPTNRPAFPNDIANAALFLLAPNSGQVTGQTIIVDGGWSALSPVPKMDFAITEEDNDENQN